jgi:hypothetical protein
MRKATEEWLRSAQDDLATIAARRLLGRYRSQRSPRLLLPSGQGAEIVDNPQLTHIVAFHDRPKSTSSVRSGRLAAL